jgi:hypothetical protein
MILPLFLLYVYLSPLWCQAWTGQVNMNFIHQKHDFHFEVTIQNLFL